MTLHRWRKNGWIKTVNIAGRVYVDMDSVASFDQRAIAGEFSQEPSGCAAASKALAAADLDAHLERVAR
jgi:hypothetical protein